MTKNRRSSPRPSSMTKTSIEKPHIKENSRSSKKTAISLCGSVILITRKISYTTPSNAPTSIDRRKRFVCSVVVKKVSSGIIHLPEQLHL